MESTNPYRQIWKKCCKNPEPEDANKHERRNALFVLLNFQQQENYEIDRQAHKLPIPEFGAAGAPAKPRILCKAGLNRPSEPWNIRRRRAVILGVRRRRLRSDRKGIRFLIRSVQLPSAKVADSLKTAVQDSAGTAPKNTPAPQDAPKKNVDPANVKSKGD